MQKQENSFCILSSIILLLNVHPSLHENAVWSESSQLLPANLNAKALYSPHFPQAFICRVSENFLLAGFYNPCMESIKRTDYIETNISGAFTLNTPTVHFSFFFQTKSMGKEQQTKVFFGCYQ